MQSMRKLIVALGILLSSAVSAQTIGVHLNSYHTHNNDKYNNQNYGVYYKNENNYVFGTYRNSLRVQSFYVAKSFDFAYPLNPSITVGAVSGYNFPVLPLVAAHVKVGPFKPTMLVAEHGVVFHLAMEWKL